MTEVATRPAVKTEHVKWAIHQILCNVGAISKDRQNQQQNYKFRGIEDVLNALQPLYAEYEIFAAPAKIVERTMTEISTKSGGTLVITNLTIIYRFESIRDGSTYEVEVVGEGGDSGDKGVNKAMSSAYKNMAFQLFCIRTEDIKDSEEENHEAHGNSRVLQHTQSPRSDHQHADLEIAIEEAAHKCGFPGSTIWDAPISKSKTRTELLVLLQSGRVKGPGAQ